MVLFHSLHNYVSVLIVEEMLFTPLRAISVSINTQNLGVFQWIMKNFRPEGFEEFWLHVESSFNAILVNSKVEVHSTILREKKVSCG